MKDINFPFYCFNQLLCIALIFLGLFLIKKENTGYRQEMEQTNLELLATNTAIKKQQDEIAEKASLLETQAAQLTQLNSVKDRLFSIISHDLRTPVYSLKNLFQSVEQYDLPGDEIKVLVPDIIKDLNYAATLMDNLLHWAKNQMQGTLVNQQLIEVKALLESTQQVARLQAAHKNITIHTNVHSGSYIYADPDMMNLVLRNLLSNAIKFTATNGKIAIGSRLKNDVIEIFVQDNGAGITKENINKLFSNSYFTTKGTADEKGTGLGLMLCKEFVEKNGGQISVSSEFGRGATFTCILPKA